MVRASARDSRSAWRSLLTARVPAAQRTRRRPPSSATTLAASPGVLAALLPACGFSPGALGSADASTGSDADAPPDGATFADTALPGAWLTGFGYRKQITITPPALTGGLTNFPVALLRASDADVALHARADGRDLVITSGDATTLMDSELSSFDSVTGALEIWARIPTLPNVGPLTSSVNLALGRGAGGASFNGLFDETRVYSLALTAPWISTEHANLTSSTFAAFSAQQTP